jgi:small subunit ribosomal protein S5
MEGNEINLIEKVVHLNRVAKVVKGGRNFKFSALVVVGDGQGRVGCGHGKANQVPDAIQKATERAKKEMVQVPVIDGTIPYGTIGRYGAGQVLLKPGAKGSGIIAGGPVRAVMEACGIQDIISKALGTNNPVNVLKATMQGLTSLRTEDEVSRLRDKQVKLARVGT